MPEYQVKKLFATYLKSTRCHCIRIGTLLHLMQNGIPQVSAQIQLRWGTCGMVLYYNRQNTYNSLPLGWFNWLPFGGRGAAARWQARGDDSAVANFDPCGYMQRQAKTSSRPVAEPDKVSDLDPVMPLYPEELETQAREIKSGYKEPHSDGLDSEDEFDDNDAFIDNNDIDEAHREAIAIVVADPGRLTKHQAASIMEGDEIIDNNFSSTHDSNHFDHLYQE